MSSPFSNIGLPSALAFGLVLVSALLFSCTSGSNVADNGASNASPETESGNVADPGFVGVAPGSGEIRMPPVSSSGPFGISMGLSMANVESLVGGTLRTVEDSANLFATTTPPRAHPNFETYVMEILPTAGVCGIRGVGVTTRSSRHGIEMRSAFTTVATAVADTYGEYEEVNQLLPGSIWDEPEDWMMGLRQNERNLQAVWKQEYGSTLSNGVAEIILGARALSSSEG